MKDDGIVLRQRCPNVRLFKGRSDVEVVLVPEHLDAGAEARRGLCVSLDIDEIVRPGGFTPSRIVKAPVDLERLSSFRAVVRFGSQGREQQEKENGHAKIR